MERILIVGATSAIAAEVARLYAQRGDRLHLVGRTEAKLVTLLESLGEAQVTASVADFTRSDSSALDVATWLATLGGIDRVLIAHGELSDQLKTERSFSEAERSIQVNFVSVVALLVPLANHLEAQGHGKLCVITSVAGERGRPRNYTYGAAKGALSLYLQGLRSRLYGTGVSVTTIKLGPVDTPMTVDHEKTALFARPGDVARAIVRAMDRGRADVFVPGFWRPIMRVVREVPEWLFQRFGFLSGR